MTDELAGKVVVVTGGSRGLGREMVLAFAERGAHVVVASRRLESCRAVTEDVAQRFGVEALPVACNVSDWEQCDQLAEAVHERFGRVDVLVNNAGLSPRYDSLVDVSRELFDKVVAVNLRGPFRLSAVLGPRVADGGAIINISSAGARRPSPGALPYAAAKAGLHALTEGFAQALAPGVRVNTIEVGGFLTDIAAGWAPGMREQIEVDTALGRCGDPHEIVGAALFLATSASSYTTGSVLRLDGGLR